MNAHSGSQDPVVLRAIIAALKGENEHLKAALKEARKDELTGLIKRTELMEAASAALSKGYLPTSMIFLDLNGFKEVNDTIGHDAGDSLLAQFAQFLREQRDGLGDNAALVTIARLGGDEFAILLSHTGERDARSFVSDIKKALKNRVFIVAGARMSLYSAMGIATTGPAISSVAELLHHADKAMYSDKAKMAENGDITQRID